MMGIFDIFKKKKKPGKSGPGGAKKGAGRKKLVKLKPDKSDKPTFRKPTAAEETERMRQSKLRGVKEKAGKGEQLSKKDKLAFVRDFMIIYPNHKRYGYNRELIKNMKKVLGIVIQDYDASRYIKTILDQWQEIKEQRYTKERIVDMLTGLYGQAEKVPDKRGILQDISKLEGHILDKHVIEGIAGLEKDELDKIKAGMKEKKA